MSIERSSQVLPESQVSSEIDTILAEKSSFIGDNKLQKSFISCLKDSLHDIRMREEKGKIFTFVETGDIHAMWLRDATIQMMPFLKFVRDFPGIQQMVLGVINLQAKFVIRDPYANAHIQKDRFSLEHIFDRTDKKIPGVFERKWEPDSLSHVIHLAYEYWQATGDTSFADTTWKDAMQKIVDTFHRQQRLHNNGNYFFQRPFTPESEQVAENGWGRPTKKIGLIHATHRPSDDATYFSFNIPENLFAESALRELAQMSDNILGDKNFATDCTNFADTIHDAIEEYGIVDHPYFGKIYAYEIDGFEEPDHKLVMDDANIPGFLSLPFLKVALGNDQVYKNTRQFILSKANDWYFSGELYEGIGSPHTGPNTIWPLSLMLEALTTDSADEILHSLGMLKNLATHDGRFNESVHINNRQIWTRRDFGMANSMFVELILKLQKQYPQLLSN